MSFQVGQQVVCINDVFWPCRYWRAALSAFPRLHGVYTIRHMREAHGLLGLCFHEIVSPPAEFYEGFVEPAFDSKNFRPVKPTAAGASRSGRGLSRGPVRRVAREMVRMPARGLEASHGLLRARRGGR